MDWKLFFGYMGYAVVFVSCTLSADPGEAKNHIHVGEYIFDLTLGPFTTLVTLPFILWGFQIIIKRQLDKRDKEREKKETAEKEEIAKNLKELDEKRKEAIALKAKMDQAWRDSLEGLILENRNHVTEIVNSNKIHIVGKLEQVCDTLKEREKDFKNHNHIIDPDKKQTIALIIKAEGV